MSLHRHPRKRPDLCQLVERVAIAALRCLAVHLPISKGELGQSFALHILSAAGVDEVLMVCEACGVNRARWDREPIIMAALKGQLEGVIIVDAGDFANLAAVLLLIRAE